MGHLLNDKVYQAYDKSLMLNSFKSYIVRNNP